MRKYRFLKVTAFIFKFFAWVILIFGIVEFALAFNNYITITHAAREGVRKAAVDLYNPELVQYIKDRAVPLELEDGDILIDWEGSPDDPLIGDKVWVEITPS